MGKDADAEAGARMCELMPLVCVHIDYLPAATGLGVGHTQEVNRERAVRLAEHVLRNLYDGRQDWPLSLVTEVYLFGSFARGALSPHDLDIDVEHENDDKWCSHFVTSLAYGRDPNALMRQLIVTGKRGCQFTFNFRGRADFELTLLWRRGDSLAAGLERLHAIKADPVAGRAPRDSMLPEFEGLDAWVPRPYREVLCAAVSSKAIGLDRVVLSEGLITSRIAAEHLAGRWQASSPLHRAATAVVRYWEQHGIDPGRCHLHGMDIRDRETPYFAGLGLRYFRSVQSCLTTFGGAEWLEVVHPTRTRPLDCLRIVPLDRQQLDQAAWG